MGPSGVDCHTSIVGQLPASLQVLEVEVGVSLEPDVLGRCSNLCKLNLCFIRAVELDLSSCSSLQSVQFIPVQKLPTLLIPLTSRGAGSLKFLEVRFCRHLVDIPGLDELIGLERLVLGHCPSFEELPDLQNLTKLQVLHLSSKAHLKRKVGVEMTGSCIPRQLRELYYLYSESNKAPNASGCEQLEVLNLHLVVGAEDGDQFGRSRRFAGVATSPASWLQSIVGVARLE